MNDMPLWLDALLVFLVLTGAVFALIGSWRLAKLPDIAKRLYGFTKGTTLGVGCVLIASSLWLFITVCIFLFRQRAAAKRH